jgi:TonB family protein
MKRWSSPAWTATLLATVVLSSGVPARAQDAELATARDLYAAAAYDEALALLNRLRATDQGSKQSRAIDQYRAFCLLALGRAGDAEHAIEAVVAAEPSYRPADGEVSPRVRSAFTEVRRRMLPVLVQQRYALAKAAFDRKEYAAAAAGFSQVLVTLTDPDIAGDAGRPPLSDLRTLSVGFEELSAKAAAPPPAPAPAPAPVAVVAAAPVVPAAPRIYTADDRTVVPPAVVEQPLPGFPGEARLAGNGKLEVVIDESGAVESAVMIASVSPAYDRLALAAARGWRYKPARVNNEPVKFRKVVSINVRPTR